MWQQNIQKNLNHLNTHGSFLSPQEILPKLKKTNINPFHAEKF